MGVNGGDALVGTGFQQLRGYDLLDGEDDAVLGADANGGASVLYGLDCIFDLEVSTVGGEDRVEQVVTRSYGRLKGDTRPELAVLSGVRRGEGSGDGRMLTMMRLSSGLVLVGRLVGEEADG